MYENINQFGMKKKRKKERPLLFVNLVLALVINNWLIIRKATCNTCSGECFVVYILY